MADSIQESSEENDNNEVVHLLWTGGWDSTFQLLHLLFKENKIVQPHYIVRPQDCTGKEIDTIHHIQRFIFEKYPSARQFLLPIKFTNVSKIDSNEEITEEYKKIKKDRYISLQYEIFARYCNQIRIHSIQTGGLAGERFDEILSNKIIFKYFEFPLVNITKVKMAQIADINGWTKIMKMTWFCRRPRKGKPCGICGPCSDAVIAGVGWRLPLGSRIIANIQVPFRKWWRNNYSKQKSGVFKEFKDFMEKKGLV